MLLTPRKDVAATYDPSSNTLQSYHYDSFGAEAGAPLSSSYDLKDNPHRYAGEYRDPLWGGYYLKARWYDPDLAIFLSRDPAAGFRPYSYSDGNPVMMVDPTGTSAQTSGHLTGETAWGSILFNVFVAPLVSIFTKEYWSDVIHNEDQAATFLAAGIVAEAALFGLDAYAVSAAWRGLSTTARWTSQTLVDAGLNAGQAAVSATHGGKFDGGAFVQNLEGLPMGMFYSRGLVGFGRRAHVLRASDVGKRAMKLDSFDVLIFRAKKSSGRWYSPVADRLGLYNDEIVKVTNTGFMTNRTELISVGYSPLIEMTGFKRVFDVSEQLRVNYPNYRFQFLRAERKPFAPMKRPRLADIKSGQSLSEPESDFSVLSSSSRSDGGLPILNFDSVRASVGARSSRPSAPRVYNDAQYQLPATTRNGGLVFGLTCVRLRSRKRQMPKSGRNVWQRDCSRFAGTGVGRRIGRPRRYDGDDLSVQGVRGADRGQRPHRSRQRHHLSVHLSSVVGPGERRIRVTRCFNALPPGRNGHDKVAGISF